MNNTLKILVTGATGQQGGAVAKALLSRGHSVRAMTRKGDSPKAVELQKMGAEIFEADFSDSKKIQEAVQGVDTVFLVTTPFESGTDAETEQGLTMLRALASQAGVHLIYSSVASADRNTGIPHFESKFLVEQAIRASGIDFTIVAPVYFMENALLESSLSAIKTGTLAMAIPTDQVLQQIATEDIGEFVAAVAERRTSVFGQRYDLAGDELDGEQAAALLSKSAGHPVSYQGISPDVIRSFSEDLAIMFEWFVTTGYSTDIPALRTEFPEVEFTSFATWAEKSSWN